MTIIKPPVEEKKDPDQEVFTNTVFDAIDILEGSFFAWYSLDKDLDEDEDPYTYGFDGWSFDVDLMLFYKGRHVLTIEPFVNALLATSLIDYAIQWQSDHD